MVLELKNVSITIDKKSIIQNVNINVPKNKFVGLVGLNGTGKSTILKAIYGINEYQGNILLNDVDIKTIGIKLLARKMAVLTQENITDFDFKVRDIVMLGRLPYKNLFDSDNKEDIKIVKKSLTYVGMEQFSDRYFNSLSGGEKQRVLIARMLAQQTDFFILDEPTNHLDIRNQFLFFEMIKNLNYTILSVLHDLNIAAKFCDFIYVIDKGKIVAQGKPIDVFTKQLLKDIFGMNVNIYTLKDDKIYIEYLNTI